MKKSGEEGFRFARRYEATCLKLSRYSNHTIFNHRCKKLGVVPRGLRVPCLVRTAEGKRIADKASREFVRERLRVTERRKKDLLEDKKWMELGLERRIGSDASKYSEMVGRKAERIFQSTRLNQRAKLDRLIAERDRRN